MSDEQEHPAYKVTIKGPGHTFEKNVDELIATKLIAFAVTGNLEAGGSANKTPDSSDNPSVSDGRPTIRGSLASHIKAKKAEGNQNRRFLATAHWLSSRGDGPLTTSAVTKALSDHNQKRLSNPADCLNQNVRKGLCEKRKGGSFFITPEGLEALDGPVA